MAGDINTHFQEGITALNKGDFAEAKGHLEAVIALAPNSPEANSYLGFIEANLGNLEAALKYTDKALNVAADNPQVRTHRAFVLVNLNRREEAIAELEAANQLAPGQAPIINQLSKLYEADENFADAEPLLVEISALSPKDPGVANRYINALVQQGKGDKALRVAVFLKTRFPDNEFVWGQIATAARAAGDWTLALENFEKLTRHNDQKITHNRGLARCLMELNRYEEAVPVLRKIHDQDPSSKEIFYSLGYTFFKLFMYDESRVFIDKILASEPDHIEALVIRGRTLVYFGELDAAKVIFEKILKLDPVHPMAHMQLVKMFPPDARDDRFDLLENLHNSMEEKDPRQSLIGFTLGEMYDALKQYDKAFGYFSIGNQRAKENFTKIGSVFDQDQCAAEFTRLKSLFSKENMINVDIQNSSTKKPIFIVGMPRSGTTLLEQIISSHSKVYGAGELPHANGIANMFFDDLGKDNLESLQQTLSAKGKIYAETYLTHLPEVEEGVFHVSDKMPNNFRHLGLLQLVMPKASYIHIRRNPLDICISMFRGVFNSTFPYACDLYALGFYYRQYDLLMKHWAEVLPRPLLEITYEDLVHNSETLGPEILEFCGLNWEPECLEYYKKKHKVITMSTYQVRKPINTSGLDKWRRYEKHIKPLLDGLGEEITSKLEL